jgi:hypothetical protein
MFDSIYLPSGRQPTVRQLDKLRWEGIHGGPNFLTWFTEHVNPELSYDLSVTCIMFNHLTNLVGYSVFYLTIYMRTYVSYRTEALLSKVTVGTTSTGFSSIQPFLKPLTH